MSAQGNEDKACNLSQRRLSPCLVFPEMDSNFPRLAVHAPGCPDDRGACIFTGLTRLYLQTRALAKSNHPDGPFLAHVMERLGVAQYCQGVFPFQLGEKPDHARTYSSWPHSHGDRANLAR